MDGHSFYKPNSFKLDNIIKLRLACDTGAADPVAGILGKSCFVGTKHWIQVNVYTYKKVITVYNKYTATLCKCNRPRNDAFRGEYFNMILLATLLKICELPISFRSFKAMLLEAQKSKIFVYF